MTSKATSKESRSSSLFSGAVGDVNADGVRVAFGAFEDDGVAMAED